MAVILEEGKETKVSGDYDVIVCGAGPAGIAAAISAARGGAKTLLLEVHGCFGGVWTAGALSWIIDSENKNGIMRELLEGLREKSGIGFVNDGITDYGSGLAYDVEKMKLLLDEKIVEAGISYQLHTRVVDLVLNESNHIAHVITESKSGREAWGCRVVIDCSGDGDVGFLAGCDFEMGHPDTREVQPLSLMLLLTGIDKEEVKPFLGGSLLEPKIRLNNEMESAGVSPSYSKPILFHISDRLYALIANHEYGILADDASAISKATVNARKELSEIVAALRRKGGIWEHLTMVATGSQIGVREGRRIIGDYVISQEDLIAGQKHEDAVCRVTFGIDVHCTNPKEGKDYDVVNKTITHAYDIPYRALIAKGVKNLLLAGRCISGDFIAHSSYRVTGNAVTMGEAAGKAAAISVAKSCEIRDVEWNVVNV